MIPSFKLLVRAVLVCAAFVATGRTADAQYAWNLTGGGEWTDPNSWTPAGGPPNGTNATASFGNGIAASSTVTITSAVTVGEINFTGITGSKAYTIGATGNTITMSSDGASVLLSSDASVTSTGMQKINSNLAASAGKAFIADIQGGSVWVAGTLGTTAGLTKNGEGYLRLSGNNTGLSGGITVNGGVLEVNGEGSGGSESSGMGTGAVTVNSGGQLKVVAAGFWEPTNAITISGNGPAGAALYHDAALAFDSFSPAYFKGTISLSADASLMLGGAFLFRGTSNGMALNGHEARFTGDVGIAGGIDGNISDGTTAGGKVLIDINGGGVDFSGVNTYTGTTVINRGTMYLYSPDALGPGLGTVANGVTINDSGGIFGKGQLYLNGFSSFTVTNKLLTLNGGILVANSGDGGEKTWTGAINLTANSIIGAEGIKGHLTLTGGIDIANHELTLRPNFDDSVITIATNGITGTGSVKVIPVTGFGTINLNATSSYSGGTTILSHRVYANATQSTGTGPVTVDGGSLRGIGSVTGAVTVTSGSIAPGAPTTTGMLTLDGGVNFGPSSAYIVRVNAFNDFDSTRVTGTTVLGNAQLTVDLSAAGTNFNPGAHQIYILRMTSGQSLQPGTTFNVADGGFVGATSDFNFFLYYDYAPGGGVYLTAYPVPEPGCIIALAAGGLGLFRLRRRAWPR